MLPVPLALPPAASADTIFSLGQRTNAERMCAELRYAAALAREEAVLNQMESRSAAAHQQLWSKASNLHHLLSTSCQPGILNSPYQAMSGTIPTVGGHPVEHHIRMISKKHVRSRRTRCTCICQHGPPTCAIVRPALHQRVSSRVTGSS